MPKANNTFEVTLGTHCIPVDVFYEYRKNVRIAAGNTSVLLRIPRYCSARERERFLEWARSWVCKQWTSNARFRASFTHFELRHFRQIRTYDSIYDLEVQRKPQKTGSAHIKHLKLHLTLPMHWEETQLNARSYKLIHGALAKHYQPEFRRRLLARHAGRFDKPVASVRMSNLTSKWGSCSHSGNFSLSTKLLFVAEGIQDYVLWHELCHLNELNHSPAFWSLVEKGEPHYKAKEEWLSEKGHLADIHFVSPRHSVS